MHQISLIGAERARILTKYTEQEITSSSHKNYFSLVMDQYQNVSIFDEIKYFICASGREYKMIENIENTFQTLRSWSRFPSLKPKLVCINFPLFLFHCSINIFTSISLLGQWHRAIQPLYCHLSVVCLCVVVPVCQTADIVTISFH